MLLALSSVDTIVFTTSSQQVKVGTTNSNMVLAFLKADCIIYYDSGILERRFHCCYNEFLILSFVHRWASILLEYCFQICEKYQHARAHLFCPSVEKQTICMMRELRETNHDNELPLRPIHSTTRFLCQSKAPAAALQASSRLSHVRRHQQHID